MVLDDDDNSKPVARGPLVAEPKRPLSAFVAYSLEARAGVKQQFPELSFTEATQRISDTWKSMPPEKRQPYLDAFAAQVLAVLP